MGADVLLVSYDTDEVPFEGHYLTMTLTAVTNTGMRLWQHSEEGTLFFCPSVAIYTNYPRFVGSMRRGHGTSLLTTQMDFEFNAGTQPSVIDVQAVDARTGVVTTLSTDEGNGFPWVWPVESLDPTSPAGYIVTAANTLLWDDGRIRARRDDGSLIWERAGLPFRSNITVVKTGDATGDSITDLLVGSDVTPASGSSRTVLVSGADGTVAWELEGRRPFSLGDANGDGRQDFATRTIQAGPTTLGRSFIKVYYDALSGDREHLWSVRDYEELSRPEGGNGVTYTTHLLVRPTDFDGDGTFDTFHQLIVSNDPNGLPPPGEQPFGGTSAAISGRNGVRLWQPTIEMLDAILDGPVAGPGEDIVDIESAPAGELSDREVSATLLNGSDGSKSWTVTLPAPGQYIEGTAYAQVSDLNDDQTNDIVLTLAAEDTADSIHYANYVLDGRNGQLLWSPTP
jgi:hypothetical protein